MTANDMVLTTRHPAMPKSSYTNYISVYSAYQVPSYGDLIILHRLHTDIQCLPGSIQC